MSGLALYQIADEYKEVFDALAEAEADEQTFNDTLETFKDELVNKGRNVAAFFQNLDAEAKALKEAEARISARRKAIENKSDSLKSYLRENMERTEIKEISCAEFVVKLGKPSVICEIENAEEIPDEYKQEVVTVKIDKNVVKKALKEGKEVPGAKLGQGKSRLTIK